MNNLILGIISGVLATIICQLSIRHLYPALHNWFFYKGIAVGGNWDIFEYRNGEERKVGSIDLKQTGRYLTGSSIRNKTRDGKAAKRGFKYKGHIYGNRIVLSFEDARGIEFDSGANIYIVQNDGNEMDGMATFNGKVENKIVSEPRKLRKTPS